MLKENLKLGERSKILKSRKQQLLRSNNLKDEEFRDLRTERKQNEEKFPANNERFDKQIRNLQAKYEEVNGRENKLLTATN